MPIFPGDMTVVSGLPRSGTSMAMAMLQAGGLELYADDSRPPDQHNPRGYFEHRDLAHPSSEWIHRACGKAVKIVSTSIMGLPHQYKYDVIFMRRDLDEIISSQAAMTGAHDTAWLKYCYKTHLVAVEDFLQRPNFRVLYLDYFEVVMWWDETEKTCRRISEFLMVSLNVNRMIDIIDPSLYRHRS